jgi:hypothetical protein
LADAKNRFSDLVTPALDEGPQRVLCHDDAVVVAAERDYEKLTGKRPGFKEFSWARGRVSNGWILPAMTPPCEK